MAVIDVQMDRTTFTSFLFIQLASGPIVPIPELDPLGPGRLIAAITWNPNLQIIDTAPPGYHARPGTLLVKAPVRIQHISIAELRADFAAPGTTYQGEAYLRVSATSSELVIAVAGLSAGADVVDWIWPESPCARFRLPQIDLVTENIAQLIASGDSVSLRLLAGHRGPVQFNDPLPPLEINAGWQITVPRTVFTEMIEEFLLKAAKPDKNIEIEEAPHVSCVSRGNGTWGVDAGVGIRKIDACPSPVFDAVDVSVDMSVSLNFDPIAPGANILASHLRIEGDASDWDAFRCWLGTFGLAGLIYLDPPQWPAAFNIPLVIGSLMLVGDEISAEINKEVQEQTIPNFHKTGGQDGWATFDATNEIPALADLGTPDISFTGAGLSISRQMILPPVAVTHEIDFSPPPPGPLAGEWSPRINCSTRSMDWSYDVWGVVITDKRTMAGTESATGIVVFGTSTAEPAGYSVNLPSYRADTQLITATAKGIVPGAAGRLYVHCSAGLRRYDIGAPAPIDDTIREIQQRLIDIRCDALHLPSTVIDRTNLKWVTPPPDWNYGIEALRQWQVSVRNLLPHQNVNVVGMNGDQHLQIASFTANGHGALIMDFVTAAGVEATLQVEHSPPRAEFRMMQRWLLPVEVLKDDNFHRVAVRRGMLIPHSGERHPEAPLSLRGDRVLAKVGDRTVLAVVHAPSALKS